MELVNFRRGYTTCGSLEHSGHDWWFCFHCEQYLYDPPCAELEARRAKGR